MDAVILCGTRTAAVPGVFDHVPAALVNVGGVPVLCRHLALIDAITPRRTVLALEERGAQVKRFFVEHHLAAPVKIHGDALTLGRPERTLIDCAAGLGGAVRAALPYLDGEGDILVGDGLCLCDADLRGLIDGHRHRGAYATALTRPCGTWAGFAVLSRAAAEDVALTAGVGAGEWLSQAEAVTHRGWWRRVDGSASDVSNAAGGLASRGNAMSARAPRRHA